MIKLFLLLATICSPNGCNEFVIDHGLTGTDCVRELEARAPQMPFAVLSCQLGN